MDNNGPVCDGAPPPTGTYNSSMLNKKGQQSIYSAQDRECRPYTAKELISRDEKTATGWGGQDAVSSFSPTSFQYLGEKDEHMYRMCGTLFNVAGDAFFV
jgi:hypothetical protein